MTDRTSEALLARRALAEKATPGPWGQVIAGLERVVIDSKSTVVCTVCLDEDFSDKETERQVLANLYYIAVNSPDVVMADIDEILRLREDVKRLEREADWLALVLANAGCGVPLAWYIDEGVNGMSPPDPEHWREAARKTVESFHEN